MATTVLHIAKHTRNVLPCAPAYGNNNKVCVLQHQTSPKHLPALLSLHLMPHRLHHPPPNERMALQGNQAAVSTRPGALSPLSDDGTSSTNPEEAPMVKQPPLQVRTAQLE